jgi:hypothetical protein
MLHNDAQLVTYNDTTNHTRNYSDIYTTMKNVTHLLIFTLEDVGSKRPLCAGLLILHSTCMENGEDLTGDIDIF